MKVYIGIDWSQNKHDLCILNQAGAYLAQLTIPHTPAGFWKIDETRKKLGVPIDACQIGVETAHNILLDFLWDQGYSPVFVLHPKMVKGSRGRFRSSAARDDTSDALLIADILRTDQGRLQAWQPDTSLTRQIRSRIKFTQFLTTEIVRLTNRQRAVLLRYYPVTLDLFSGLNTLIAQHFIREYPAPQAATSLGWDEFEDFLKRHRYPKKGLLPRILAQLQQSYPKATAGVIEACYPEAQSLAGMLLEMISTKKKMLKELGQLFNQHPDHEIYASLPGTGAFLQPALLSKFGDDRARFPTADRVQALAGTSPVTISSGKRRRVQFRHSCDHEFRHIAQQWAKSSLRTSIWANAYYTNIRPHCESESHAFRCLANRWLAILWRLWQDGQPYDETYHLRQRTLRSQPWII
jgi:transposase